MVAAQRLVVNGVFQPGGTADPLAVSLADRATEALAALPPTKRVWLETVTPAPTKTGARLTTESVTARLSEPPWTSATVTRNRYSAQALWSQLRR